MAPNTHAEMLAAANAARAAFQEKPTTPGFPGAVDKTPKKPRAKRLPDTQALLWDLPPPLPPPPPPPPPPAMDVVDPEEPVDDRDPAVNLIQRALRMPIRPSPNFENPSERNMSAYREVIGVGDSFVVRQQLGESSIYSFFIDRKRTAAHEQAIAAIRAACCEAAEGTCSQACVVVNVDGPAPTDLATISRWLLQQADRERAHRRVDRNAWRSRT